MWDSNPRFPLREPNLKSCALDRSANLAVINNIIYKEQTLKLNLTMLCDVSRCWPICTMTPEHRQHLVHSRNLSVQLKLNQQAASRHGYRNKMLILYIDRSGNDSRGIPIGSLIFWTFLSVISWTSKPSASIMTASNIS